MAQTSQGTGTDAGHSGTGERPDDAGERWHARCVIGTVSLERRGTDDRSPFRGRPPRQGRRRQPRRLSAGRAIMLAGPRRSSAAWALDRLAKVRCVNAASLASGGLSQLSRRRSTSLAASAMTTTRGSAAGSSLSGRLGDALLEGAVGAVLVDGGGALLPELGAELEEVLPGGGSLGEGDTGPPGDEVDGVHGRGPMVPMVAGPCPG